MPFNLVAPSRRLPRMGGRCMLQRRRRLPLFNRPDQVVYTIHITPAERIDPRRNPCRLGADIWSQNRDNPT